MMIYVSLTHQQREELTCLSHQAIGRVALRAQMVVLSDRGFTVQEIATLHECGEDVVRTWLHRYQQKGVVGLEDEPRVSAPTERIRRRAGSWTREASQSPPCSGHIQTCWSVSLLTAFEA
jgi:hypothetical protein